MTQQTILVNQPICDQTCMYYHSHSGCKYGEYCHYKHLEPCSSSPYQTLLQYYQMNNQLLHKILSCLQAVISKTTTTVSKPEPTQQPIIVHELKRDTPTPPPALKPAPISAVRSTTTSTPDIPPQTEQNMTNFNDPVNQGDDYQNYHNSKNYLLIIQHHKELVNL